MTRRGAALVSALHFLVAPGVVVGLAPWLLTGWERETSAVLAVLPAQVVGAALVVVATAALVREFARFVAEGGGTPAPPAPTQTLVVGGLYRHVRNPMYVAVEIAVLGQALLLASLALVVYAIVIGLVMCLFVRAYEEPTLRRQFGSQYDAYRAEVPAWLPRLHARRP